MRIVRLRTGAAIAVLPDRQLIVIDPSMGHHTAVGAIRAVMPDAHPDAIEHWVEDVIPTAQPLEHHHLGRHRRQVRARRVDALGRAAMRIVAMAATMALGAIGALALAAPHPSTAEPPIVAEMPADVAVPLLGDRAAKAPSIAPVAWNTREIRELRHAAEWECGAGELATMCDVEGVDVEVTAQIGLHMARYDFSYTDKLGRQQYGVFLLFKTEEDMDHHQAVSASLKLQNLIVGPRWLMFGTDGHGLRLWAQKIKDCDLRGKGFQPPSPPGGPRTKPSAEPDWWGWWK